MDMNDYNAGLRWQRSALLALQEATEAYLVALFRERWGRLGHIALKKAEGRHFVS